MRQTLTIPGLMALLAVPSVAQIAPGHSVAALITTGVGGEMYDVDHTGRTATKLTLPASLVTEQTNCVLMTSPVSGFVGTSPTTGTANIYAITIVGTTVTATLLNTTATKLLSCVQLALFAGRVYFCVNNSTTPGWIQSVPTGGGAVQDELDLTTVGAIGLGNAVCEMNAKIYCATFNSSPGNSATTPGELVEYDPIVKTGRKVMNLPVGKFDPVGNPWNTGIVNIRPYPLQAGVLALCGVYGDMLYINPVTATVVAHEWTGTKNAGGNSLASGSVNSFDWDPIAKHWVIGTRYGAIEFWVGEQQAEKAIVGIGSNVTPTSNSITGLQYFPFGGGSDASYGAGCQGAGTWEPTDASFGAPQAGNGAFKIGVFSADGGDQVALLLGLQNVVFGSLTLPLDLAFLGATPSCFLRTDIIVSLPATTTGVGQGEGQVVLSLPLPASAAGAKIYRQWAVLQGTPTNPLGLVVSNARLLQIQ